MTSLLVVIQTLVYYKLSSNLTFLLGNRLIVMDGIIPGLDVNLPGDHKQGSMLTADRWLIV